MNVPIGATRRMMRSSRPMLKTDLIPDCCWPDCRNPRISEQLPLCQWHAAWTAIRWGKILDDHDAPAMPEPKPALIYYLAVGPDTVKIGTTRNLAQRLRALRTEAQYVLAVETGDFTLETQRHKQFAAERIGRREDFRMSERLMAHIDDLRPASRQLMTVHIQDVPA